MKMFSPGNAFAGAARSLAAATLVGTVVACSLGSAEAATLWSTDFIAPPYKLDKTVVGEQGWEESLFDSNDESDASLVTYAGATGGTALRLISTSTDSQTTRRRSAINNAFEKVQGSKVEVNLSVAYDWTGASGSAASFAFHAAESNSPVILSFSGRDGLVLGGTYGSLASNSILSAAQMAKNSFYHFKILFDFEERTFDLTVAGVDVEGEVFNYTVDGLSFRTGTPTGLDGIDSLRLMNFRGDNIQMYLDQASIVAIPEGNTAGMLGGAAVVLGMGGLLHRSKVRP